MPALSHKGRAEHLQCFLVIAVADFSDAAFELKSFLRCGDYLHPVSPAHRIVTESVALNGKQRFCACPWGYCSTKIAQPLLGPLTCQR